MCLLKQIQKTNNFTSLLKPYAITLLIIFDKVILECFEVLISSLYKAEIFNKQKKTPLHNIPSVPRTEKNIYSHYWTLISNLLNAYWLSLLLHGYKHDTS